MKAIGYAGASLYGCKYGAFSIVICAPDIKTAREAFELFLKDRNRSTPSVSSLKIKRVKTLGERPLFWAQVDVKST